MGRAGMPVPKKRLVKASPTTASKIIIVNQNLPNFSLQKPPLNKTTVVLLRHTLPKFGKVVFYHNANKTHNHL